MAWVTAKYSKGEVKRAGESLTVSDLADDQRLRAMDVLSNWRAAHAYPMHAVLIYLRNVAGRVDSNAVVAQRLKRTPSIIGKLVRYKSMSLSRMQDIAGCRAVVKSTLEVRALTRELTSSRTRNKLHKIDDYIEDPKESGYRGVHLVYKYNGEKNDYTDYFVEIQLRSKIQHAWATALEIVDAFTKQTLKASKGESDWLDFFRYASVEFAKIEKCPVGAVGEQIDTLAEVKRLAAKLNVLNKLNAFAVSTRHLSKMADSTNAYFLLELTDNATTIRVSKFLSSRLTEATGAYLEKEEQAKTDESYNVVLVATNSIKALKQAYPNYFADSKDFLRLLTMVLRT
jgi:hypothetical protein